MTFLTVTESGTAILTGRSGGGAWPAAAPQEGAWSLSCFEGLQPLQSTQSLQSINIYKGSPQQGKPFLPLEWQRIYNRL